MTTNRSIDNAVAIPANIRGGRSSVNVASLDALTERGMSFHIPATDDACTRFQDANGNPDLAHAAKAMQSTLFYPSKDRAMRVTVRPVDATDPRGPGIRVWRTGDR